MSDAAAAPPAPVVRVRQAAEGPLRSVDLDLPLNRLACFTGPAGHGARSMAVDVLWAESRRRYMLALSPVERQDLGAMARVGVESITGLPPAVCLSAAATGAGSVAALLRVDAILAQLVRRVGEVRCPQCGGSCRSYSAEAAATLALQDLDGQLCLVLAPLALTDPERRDAVLQEMRRAGFLRVLVGDRVLRIDRDAVPADSDLLEVVVDRLTPAAPARQRLTEAIRSARAIARGHSLLQVVEGARRLTVNQQLTCGSCLTEFADLGADDLLANPTGEGGGPRVVLDGRTLADLLATPLGETRGLLSDLGDAEGLAASVERALAPAVDLGLAHLPLDRPPGQVGTGERLRLALAASLSSGLVGLLYVVDAPSRGLTQDQLVAVSAALRRLVEQGNTVVVLDHAAPLVAAADFTVSFREGCIVPPEAPPPAPPAAGRGPSAAELLLVGEGPANLRAFEVSLPLERLVCLCGPSGAGKSVFLRQVLAAAVRSRGRRDLRVEYRGHPGLHRVVEIAASDVDAGRTLMEVLGLVEAVARLYAAAPTAQQRRYPPEWFRLDAPGGRCASCEGRGVLHFDMQFLEDIHLTCPTCGGRRFRPEVLEVTVRGLTLADVLDMDIDLAGQQFGRDPRLAARLEAAQRCGLGRHALGLTLRRLEHGERVRLHLALELARVGSRDLLLLDLPLGGEHPEDAAMLVSALQEAAARGATVVAADNHPLLLDAADVVLQLGPGSGPDGGHVSLQQAASTGPGRRS